ncbi:helix-turn-helix domain-containing protein [Bordetella muralis]|jgi:AraC-like DNA-binding protein|uniref:helix-turn-helix domain-containing protein n=1 Tax=Bordetella muralis TaxID=1649130 RepID=UPI0039EE3AC2
MRFKWVPGAAHSAPRSIVNMAPTVRVRMGVGYGAEAFYGQALRSVSWPAGALEFVPPAIEHVHTTGLDADWLSVEFDVAEWRDVMGRDAAERDLRRCDAGYRCANFPELMRSAYRVLTAVPFEADFLRQELGAQLANQCRQCIDPASRDRRQSALNSAMVKRLAALVEECLHGDIRLEQMANEAGLSKFHFTTAFGRATGVTPYQYILGRRLSRAQKLLRSTNMPITTVALDCGFSSHAHLTSAFTSRFGVSPTIYRRIVFH